MKISFSTLACPEWNLAQVLDIATRVGYDGVELRFLEGEDSLWKLPDFHGVGLAESRRRISESGLAISCLDTSCRFDSPEKAGRERWIEEGERLAELAFEVGAPGIRVFGDRINAGVQRETARKWITDCLAILSQKTASSGVGVWLETHGDFSGSSEVLAILSECREIELVWDPAAALVESGERPLENGTALQAAIRHAHVKDLRRENGQWSPVLTGEGEFPLAELRTVLEKINYAGFLSFEWEKKWHPAIEAPEVAIPHFAKWFRRNWETLGSEESSHVSGSHS